MDKQKYQIRNVSKAIVNGQNRKMFQLWAFMSKSGCWVYSGTFTAPVRTAKKNLFDFVCLHGCED